MSRNTQGMPGAERDDESGQYTETYPTEDFLEAIDTAEGMAGTQDVADHVGCSYETAYKKLRALEDSGPVNSQKVANARVWLRATEPTRSEQRETRVSTAQSDDGGETPDDTTATTHAAPAVLGGVEFPSTRDRDACERAVLAARDYIRDHGGATKGEIVRGVMPDLTLGYDVDAALEKLDSPNRYRGGWWRNVVTDGLEALDDIKKPDPGASVWEYTGDQDAANPAEDT